VENLGERLFCGSAAGSTSENKVEKLDRRVSITHSQSNGGRGLKSESTDLRKRKDMINTGVTQSRGEQGGIAFQKQSLWGLRLNTRREVTHCTA